ncbi:MAG: PEGA domain-containing protein [Thermoanaerobaculaceae bacterium]|nr:PEGA domain-containing protein [Thermoanaerobaculaceae bacterium]
MRALSCLLVVWTIASAAAALAGDVQVLCEPGLQVFLDGVPVGVSNAREDGLFLRRVAEGHHTIRVEREGYVARSYEVEVGAGPTEVRVEPLEPAPPLLPQAPATPQEVAPSLATLVVTSAPQNCTVTVGERVERKAAPTLRLAELAPGQYRIVFSKDGYANVEGTVRLEAGSEHTVHADLIAGTVTVVQEGWGSLRIVSRPEFCTVWFLGKRREKIHSIFNLTRIPAGDHRLVVACKGRQVATDIRIRNRQRTVVRVDLLSGQPLAVTYEPE